MNAHEQVPRLRASRLAHVEELVRAARDRTAEPARGPHLFDDLLHRLRRVHDTCEQVGDRAWGDYVIGLDRGLDELAVELGRTAEPTAADPADDVLHVHATRLEIDGWVLRLDHARDGSEVVRDAAERAARDLDGYRRGETTRDDLDRAVEDLRAAAGS